MSQPDISLDAPPLLPLRMLNEFAYCPRLGYLEWAQGEFADSADTVDGRFQHRVVDKSRQRRRESGGDGEPVTIHERSVQLASEHLGLTAKIDLVEGEGSRVTPVDYKRGKRPHLPKGAYEPELVQLCAQGPASSGARLRMRRRRPVLRQLAGAGPDRVRR